MADNSTSSEFEGPDPILRVSAGFITLVMSSYGLLVNLYVFKSFVSSTRFRSDFHILCTSRTISNSITCFVYFIWSSPCTIIGFLYLPDYFNIIFGQTAGWGGYTSGLFVQSIISINRFQVSYWPFRGGYWRKRGTPISLCLVWFTAAIYTSIGFPTGCAFIYIIEELSWAPMDDPCAYARADFLFDTIIVIATISNTLNCFTFSKLLYDTKKNSSGLSSKQSKERQRRSRIMFAQSCVQDLLHLIDITSSIYISQLNSAVWFLFITMSVSWLGVHVIDGTVMLIFNKDIHPKFCRGKLKASTATMSGLSENKSRTITLVN